MKRYMRWINQVGASGMATMTAALNNLADVAQSMHVFTLQRFFLYLASGVWQTIGIQHWISGIFFPFVRHIFWFNVLWLFTGEGNLKTGFYKQGSIWWIPPSQALSNIHYRQVRAVFAAHVNAITLFFFSLRPSLLMAFCQCSVL